MGAISPFQGGVIHTKGINPFSKRINSPSEEINYPLKEFNSPQRGLFLPSKGANPPPRGLIHPPRGLIPLSKGAIAPSGVLIPPGRGRGGGLPFGDAPTEQLRWVCTPRFICWGGSYISLFEVLKGVMLPVVLQVPFQSCPLPPQVRWHLPVNVGKEELRVRLQLPLRLLERLHHLQGSVSVFFSPKSQGFPPAKSLRESPRYHFAGAFAPALLLLLVPPAPVQHVMPQPGNGMILFVPIIHLVHRAVR